MALATTLPASAHPRRVQGAAPACSSSNRALPFKQLLTAAKPHAARSWTRPAQPHLRTGGVCARPFRQLCTASAFAGSDAAQLSGVSSAPQQPAPITAEPIGGPITAWLVHKLLAVLATVALWSFLSTCFAGGGTTSAFGSLTIAAPTSAHGIKTAVKSVWTGLAAGVLHTLCGPDHLAALTPLTIGRDRVTASALGALWGFGHSTGQLILGLAMVMLKDRFHNFVPALERWSGVVVACTLVAIGLMGFWEQYLERRVGVGRDAPTVHAEEEQRAMKLALAGAESGNAQATSLKASLATYATGIIYGLQPDALFVVVPALALPTKAAAIAYCSTFVIGTVMAMGGYTLLIGTTSAALMRERPWLQAHLSTITSGIAIVVGVLIGLAGMGLQVPFFSG